MKKLLSILLAAMLIVACFGMVGCGVNGKYELYAIEIAGKECKDTDEFEMMKERYGTFELAKDGVYKVNGEEAEGVKWEKRSDGIYLVAEDGEEEKVFEKDGNKLIAEGNGMKLIFKKA